MPITYEFTCRSCGSHRFYIDSDDQLLSIRFCMDCHMNNAMATDAATLEAEVINYNEITSVGAIAASYLCGRRILLNGKVYTIGSVWQTIGSRMALTIACEGGPTKRVYLPSRIELMPENGEQD